LLSKKKKRPDRSILKLKQAGKPHRKKKCSLKIVK
jgi:hypothetical protein